MLRCCLTDGGGLPTGLLSQPEIGNSSGHLVGLDHAVYLYLVGDNDENIRAKLRLQIVRRSNDPPETNPLYVSRAASRALPDHPWPLTRAGESADLSIWRPKQQGFAARRPVALPLALRGQQRSLARWSLARRRQPQPAARLRRSRRSRRQPGKPVQPKTPPLTIFLEPPRRLSRRPTGGASAR